MSDKNEKRLVRNYRIIKCIAKIFSYTIFRMRIWGLDNIPREGSFLLLCNHQSFLDPVLIGVPIYRRLHFVARSTLFKSKIMDFLLKSCLVIPIKRGQADSGAIKTILRTLKQGHGVGLFPEATRTLDGKIIDVKPGFGLLVRKSKAVIIPTVIEGAYESWPRTRKFFLPGDITISYGKAITPEETSHMDDETFAKVITEKLREMQNSCRERIGKKAFEYNQTETSLEGANASI